MKILIFILMLFPFSKGNLNPCENQDFSWVCDTGVGIGYSDQTLQGCVAAAFVELHNVKIDSGQYFHIYVKDTVTITGTFQCHGDFQIIKIPCE